MRDEAQEGGRDDGSLGKDRSSLKECRRERAAGSGSRKEKVNRAAAANSSLSERLNTNALLTFQTLRAYFSLLTAFSPPAPTELKAESFVAARRLTALLMWLLKKETFIY